ncbi:MAG: molybdenum cofactor biosynthesis protein B [Beijerinckiaceae bacterium]
MPLPMPTPRIDESRPFMPLGIAVLTVSDTRTLADDKSGDTLAGRVTAAGHKLAARAIVTDDVDKIQSQVKAWIADPAVDVIISTGGTGFTGRDVTVEAMTPLFEKTMDGFSALFHRISYEKIGTSTIQSRATGGVAGGTYIFVLPGSPGACKDAWDGILASQLDYRHMPCNFVEIMPRLDEHLRRGAAK